MAGFNITPRAKHDLHSIWRYTRDTWGEAQADTYVSALYRKFSRLAETPRIGRNRADIDSRFYCFPEKKHLIFYIIYDAHIDIIGVVHKSMDVENYFDEE